MRCGGKEILFGERMEEMRNGTKAFCIETNHMIAWNFLVRWSPKLQSSYMLHRIFLKAISHEKKVIISCRLLRKAEDKGKFKAVRVNGTVECTDPDCISYKAGYCIRGRDANAALNIVIAGYSQLVSSTRENSSTIFPKATTVAPPYTRCVDA